MQLTMSMFATKEDYWKARAEIAEQIVIEIAEQLKCEADNEIILDQIRNAQKGLSSGCDFGKNIWNFEFENGFEAGAGEYLIIKLPKICA